MTSIANSTFPAIPNHVDAETGPRLLGFMFHWGLFGALCVQVYIYQLAFQRDPIRNKILVFCVFAIELTQTVLFTQSAFYIFAQGFGNLENFNNIRFTWLSAPLMTGIVAFIAQIFYAYRISILARNYTVAAIVLLLALVQLVGAISTAVVQNHAGSFVLLLGQNYSISAGIWNGTSAVCDAIIAFAMTFYLSQRGSHAMKSTKVIVRRIIAMVIETGTITAVLAIVNLVLSVLPGKPLYFLASSETLGKFYSNSMMAVLNSRMRLGDMSDDAISLSTADLPSSMVQFTSRKGLNMTIRNVRTEGFELSQSRGGGGGVRVTREEVVFPDQGANASKEDKDSGKGYLV